MGGEERVEIPVQAEVGAFLTQALKFRAGIGYDPQPQCAQTIWQSMPLLMLDSTQLDANPDGAGHSDSRLCSAGRIRESP